MTMNTAGMAIGLVKPVANTVEEVAWGVVESVENKVYSIVDKTVNTGLSAYEYAKDTAKSIIRIGSESSQ